MQKQTILWADDEIDLLKPYILFLDAKGYEVTPVNSGADALEKFQEKTFDLVFLDENMPGMTGLETLAQLKTIHASVPIVMITKSEEEHIMEQAIGSKIADYLIKPLNPNQILLSVKKLLDNKRLVSETTTQHYQQEFRSIGMALGDRMNFAEWTEVYKKIVYWELAMEKAENSGMREVLDMQKTEANQHFTKFIKSEYENWLNEVKGEKPMFSHQIMKKKVFPLLAEKEPVFFILIDNLRLDQWRLIEPMISEYYKIQEEGLYYSILPTTTAYARNAIFSGLLPSDIVKQFPEFWVGDDEEEGKNNHESDLLKYQLQRNKIEGKFSYHKILNVQQGKSLNDSLPNLMNNAFNAIVYNFVDMLSHARTDMQMIRELAADESAYRSLTVSWFTHSPLFDLLKKLAEKKVKVFITTDHGTIRVKNPVKVQGDKETNNNLRYKQGKNLAFNEKEVFFTRKPERFFLPKKHVSTTYVFAAEDDFLAYPNNFNYYVNFYKDTFQHGGISMEEVMIPFAALEPK